MEPNFDADYLHALQVEHEACERILDEWLDAKWIVPPLRFRENRDYLMTLVQAARESARPTPMPLADPWAAQRVPANAISEGGQG